MSYPLAITGTAGATVAYWFSRTRRCTCWRRKIKSNTNTTTASNAGESQGNPTRQLQSSVVEPTVNTRPQSPTQSMASDTETSSSDENVRSSSPVSSEQISVCEMDESQFVSQPATTTEPPVAAAGREHPASTPTQPPVTTGKTLNSAKTRNKSAVLSFVTVESFYLLRQN